MKKLMTAMLGLSLLTGLAAVSFARPDDPARRRPRKRRNQERQEEERTKERRSKVDFATFNRSAG